MPNQIFRNAIQLFSLILPLKQKDDCVPLFVFLAYIIFFQNVLLLFPPPLSAALVYSVTRQDPYPQNISPIHPAV